MNTIVITEAINSELIEWWLSKTPIQRESIMFQAYAKEKMGG